MHFDYNYAFTDYIIIDFVFGLSLVNALTNFSDLEFSENFDNSLNPQANH